MDMPSCSWRMPPRFHLKLHAQSFEGRRCLLVITGKGTARDGGGVLRSAVPRWITEGAHRERLIGIGPADSRHGGDGALYVLLRRPRDPVIG